MTRTRLILIAAVSALLLTAVACGSGLPGAGDDNELRSGALEGLNDPQSDGSAPDSSSLTGIPEGDASRDAVYGTGASHGDIVDGEAVPPADPQLHTVLDRKIIQSTSVNLDIEGENGVVRTFQDIVRIAETAGGFVASSSLSNVDDRPFADVTIRVPGTQYQTVLADIRGMGTVTEETSDANDVTEEYTDLQARLRTLNATEQRYLELLARAETINDILVVQDRLDVVRGQTEQVIGRMNLLDNLTDLATITAHLSPAALAVDAPSDGGGLSPSEAFENAWHASLTVLGAIAIGALVVVAFSWWLVPVLAVLAFGARWRMNRNARRATGAQPL